MQKKLEVNILADPEDGDNIRLVHISAWGCPVSLSAGDNLRTLGIYDVPRAQVLTLGEQLIRAAQGPEGKEGNNAA